MTDTYQDDALWVPRRDPNRLSTRGRIFAGAFLTIGLATFFAPLITVDPPVSGRSQWSLLQIVFRSRDLHPLNFWEISFGLFYLLMFVAFITVCFYPSRELLAGIGALNALFSRSLWGLVNKRELDLILYGHAINFPPLVFLSGRGVNARPLIIVLDGIMVILILVVWADSGE